MYGCDVAGVRRPLLLSRRGPRVRSSRHYQTLPSQRHLAADDELSVSQSQPQPTTAHHGADRRRAVAHAAYTGNSYGGGRLSSDDGGERRRQRMFAVSDVDLTSCVESTTSWQHPPSSTDLLASSTADQDTADLLGSLHRAGLSLQELPDTHL